MSDFNPDWELNATEKLSVALSISLSKHIPDWPGATDEQLAEVAVDIATDTARDFREANAALIAELEALTRLNRMLSDQLKESTETIRIVAAEQDALKDAKIHPHPRQDGQQCDHPGDEEFEP